MVALIHCVGGLCRLCFLLLHFLLPYKGKLSAFGRKRSRKTVEWVVNVGHKLVLFRLDCCVCGQLNPVACTLVVALFADRVLKECLVSIKKSCTGNVFVVSCDV